MRTISAAAMTSGNASNAYRSNESRLREDERDHHGRRGEQPVRHRKPSEHDHDQRDRDDGPPDVEQRSDPVVVEELGERVRDSGERIDGATAVGGLGLDAIGVEKIAGAVARPDEEHERAERSRHDREDTFDAAADAGGAEAAPRFDRRRYRDHDAERAGESGQRARRAPQRRSGWCEA